MVWKAKDSDVWKWNVASDKPVYPSQTQSEIASGTASSYVDAVHSAIEHMALVEEDKAQIETGNIEDLWLAPTPREHARNEDKKHGGAAPIQLPNPELQGSRSTSLRRGV